MSKGETLRALVTERLTAAAEDIFALVERTIAEYEQELCRSQQENQRRQQLLEESRSPNVRAESIDVQTQTDSQQQHREEGLSPRVCTQSTDVLIQTESPKKMSFFKQESEDLIEVCEERPEVTTSNELETEDLIEVCSAGPTIPQTTVPQITNPSSSADLSSAGMADKTKELPAAKRKRGRPRRVFVATDAEEQSPQKLSKQTNEKQEGTKNMKHGGAGTEAHPVSLPSKTQTEIKGVATRKKDWDQTAARKKDWDQTAAPNYQIKTEKQDEGPTLDQVDVASHDQLWRNMEVIERKEPVQDFTTATNEQTKCRGDTECENWSFDWQPQPGSSQQLIDTDDEDYNPSTDNDLPFLELAGKKSYTKSGKSRSDSEGKVKHECPVCRKKLGRKQELKRHMLLHTGEKPFSCPVCNKRFIQKSNLKSHIVTHLDSVDTIIRFQKPMEASRGEMEGNDWDNAEGDLCSDPQDKLTDNLSDSDNDEDWAQMMEPSASGSPQQMETEAGEDSRSLERISLLLHQALNESKARGKTTEFQCPMCDKIFGRMENLRRHLLVHTGEKAFSCPVCSKQFTLKQHLKLHMVLHTRDQQFTCSVCSKTFIRKDNLRSHMRIHSTDRPFGCSQCGARFYTDQDLSRHTAHHTGERPFVCPVCNSGFLSRRYLNRHIKIHRKEEEKAEKLN